MVGASARVATRTLRTGLFKVVKPLSRAAPGIEHRTARAAGNIARPHRATHRCAMHRRIWMAMTSWTLLTGAMACGGNPEDRALSCLQDTHCSAGEVCREGQCHNAADAAAADTDSDS